ncbi:heme ABC transporter permease CcmC [Sphingomonas psychrolutea]|uniref:Heme exporter protein C n=1 Tax=Sphingomonas psychrolutea TaxID=1259676 RepID=A0ABQ1GL18_9SPHN|nr:heme ABC transporter permease CcmC [Sphingomonas psychrolutea]GGA45723.1 cytochrome C biogenesis protein CcmC [Sphingomonas psychrolutea]
MPSLHALANPARFLKIARPLTPLLFWAGVLLLGYGVWGGLTQTPADYLQGETVRILYIHVPTAWLGMSGWSGIAVSSLVFLIWRHPLAMIAARAIALPGAVFAALCLATGSIWGRPTWGTWWQWDGRLTSMLLLFFVYLGFMALVRADDDRGGDGRIPAIYGIAGSVLLPIIRYSVVWWNTLHQGQSIGITKSSIDPSILWPLWFTLGGFTLLFAGIVLMRMRTILARTKAEARMRRMANVVEVMA